MCARQFNWAFSRFNDVWRGGVLINLHNSLLHYPVERQHNLHLTYSGKVTANIKADLKSVHVIVRNVINTRDLDSVSL